LAFLGAPFEVSLIMVQGGPLDATTSLAYYAYKVAFDDFDIGYASAITMAQFFVMLAIALTVLQIRKVIKKRG
jgi:ABC-type sugar transport system permease subunit